MPFPLSNKMGLLPNKLYFFTVHETKNTQAIEINNPKKKKKKKAS